MDVIQVLIYTTKFLLVYKALEFVLGIFIVAVVILFTAVVLSFNYKADKKLRTIATSCEESQQKY